MTSNVNWAIIGAGPAGIATVGSLLDHGVSPSDIVWIDPAFAVGDFGCLWSNVPSNTTVSTFLGALESCRAFELSKCSGLSQLQNMPQERGCCLKAVADLLSQITRRLSVQVSVKRDFVECLDLRDNLWFLTLKQGVLSAQNVVLAVGAEPKYLPYTGVERVELQHALDGKTLAAHVAPHDSVAVFGSSHSAILVLRALLDCGVTRVVNFYRSALRYALDMGDWILFDNTGLKGEAAAWAKGHVNTQLHANLERYFSSEENIQRHLPTCNKAIYAVGFERRAHPVIDRLGVLQYNNKTGIIAPGLFGVGIAFPEGVYDRFNNFEHSVGIRKFMHYLQRVMPVWLQYQA